MGVSLRTKQYKSGTNTYYLDIFYQGHRRFEFLDIQFRKADPSKLRKEKKELAESIRAKRQLEIESYMHGEIPKHRRKANFNDYYNQYLDRYQKKDKRMLRYAYEKFSELTQFKRLSANEITVKLMEEFRDYLKSPAAGLTGETPYDYFTRFKKVLKQAHKDGLIHPQVYDGIQEIDTPKRDGNSLKKQILTIDELRVLIQAPCGNDEVKRAFLFACFTGLGEAEIRKLTWARILKENKIRLFREKSGSQILNDLPNTAIKLLGPRGSAGELVFNLPSNVAVHKNLRNWMKAGKVEKHVSFYCGRHTFAVMLLMNGANLKTVADCLGHSSTKHTIKYLNYVDELKTQAIRSLPGL